MVSFPGIAIFAAIGLAVAAPAAAHGAFSELQGITTKVDTLDELPPASAPKQLGPKGTLTLPGAGTPFWGTSRVPNTTHKLHGTR
jgi:hypothetical protein